MLNLFYLRVICWCDSNYIVYAFYCDKSGLRVLLLLLLNI